MYYHFYCSGAFLEPPKTDISGTCVFFRLKNGKLTPIKSDIQNRLENRTLEIAVSQYMENT